MKSLKLRHLLVWQWRGWSLSGLLGLLTVAATVLLLAYSGWFISAAAMAGVAAIQAGSFNYMRPGAVIRFLAITRTAGRYAERLQSHHTVLSLLKNLRVNTFHRLSHQSIADSLRFEQPDSAETLQRLISDIDLLDQFPLRAIAPWFWAIALGGFFSLAIAYYLPSALFSIVLLLLMRLILLPLMMLPLGIHLAKQEVNCNGQRRQVTLIGLQLLTTLLTFGRWQDYAQTVADNEQTINRLQQRLQLSVLIADSLAQLLLLVGIICLAMPGTSMVLEQALHPAILVALLLAWLGLSEVFQALSSLHLAIGYSVAAKNRTNQLIASSPSAKTESASKTVDILSQAELNFSIADLCFGFKPQAILTHQQNQTFKAGDVVLLSGPSGIGKSCLLQTLAGDIPKIAGSIALNQQLQHQFNDNTWHQYVGYLPQRPFIFQLTIAADLRLAKPKASDTELSEILSLVGLQEWLAKQSHGLQTILGEYGVGLSGGELRRFTLARLLLAKTPVLLLDEPFSGLDQASTEQLLQGLLHWQRDGILIIASHQQLEHPAFTKRWHLGVQ
ncbi:amino acid ABC transporter ATP-binding/permease protein [Agarivorans sp. QJM3NY_33]|uniref:amino acid ABC transporter ATP-binding/permease protein n=1 Tax=Agarivorans sp. QJM3NY_33 TaxID=3421432 RepID=UPI003D7CEC8A